MTIRLSFISHGPTSALRTAAFPLDEPLSSPDTMAPSSLIRADQCWCGPELRTRQTATQLSLEASVDLAISDCDYGRWQGITMADIQASEPDAIGQWLTDPAAAPHGGESIHDLLARIGNWMDALHPHPERRGSTYVVAVTHQAVIRAGIVHALQATPASFWRIDVSPLSQVDLVGRNGRWSLTSMAYLPPPPA